MRAVPVFAMTHQEKLACAMTAGNCLDRGKLIEKRIMEIKNEKAQNTNGSPEEVKKLEKNYRKLWTNLNGLKTKPNQDVRGII